MTVALPFWAWQLSKMAELNIERARAKVLAYLGRKRGSVNKRARKTKAVKTAVFNPAWRFTNNHHVGRSKNYGEVYIYGLADPRDHVIRYVGKTVKSIQRRIEEHMEFPTNPLMSQWLTGLKASGLLPEGVALEICAPERWEEAERRWIARLRKLGSLMNIEAGGENPRKTRWEDRWKKRGFSSGGGPVRRYTRDEVAELNRVFDS